MCPEMFLDSRPLLPEGTIRALRDLALDEALELHKALKFWTYRWENPVLSWLEEGPGVWFSEKGYNHNLVGQKVSQVSTRHTPKGSLFQSSQETEIL